MPVYIAAQALYSGLDSIPFLPTLLRLLPYVVALVLLKLYCQGASNPAERNMHGKVVIITGGTSGIGAQLTHSLATRGAHLILLVPHPLTDPFLADYIADLRASTKNNLITAEHVDLASLHSIRAFATRWLDNAPPRRLDMVILCAETTTTAGLETGDPDERVERVWMVNYLANFHLLGLLSPALRAQPPDRDVRVLIATCASYLGGDLLHISPPKQQPQAATAKTKQPKTADPRPPTVFSPANAHATSKLALTTFAAAYQKHLLATPRPDNFPPRPRVIVVDPGWCRTPGMRRWLTRGSLWGLAGYVVTWPVWWVLLKSAGRGAEGFLFAGMEERFGRIVGEGGASGEMRFVKECKERKMGRVEVVGDEGMQRDLWKWSEEMVVEAERRGVEGRRRRKMEEAEAKEMEEAEREVEGYREKVGKKRGRGKKGG